MKGYFPHLSRLLRSVAARTHNVKLWPVIVLSALLAFAAYRLAVAL